MKFDYTNKKFGMLTCISYSHSDGKNSWWLCRCDCGTEKILRSVNMRNKNNVSCGCHRKKKGNQHNAWRGIGQLGNSVYGRLKLLAKKRSIPFEVSQEFLWKLFEKQKAKCALSGIDIILPTDYRPGYNSRSTASLDRIDSSKGYTNDNVQWVHKKINMMKQTYSQNEFIAFCKLVAEKNRSFK